jgi:hypothetical protein
MPAIAASGLTQLDNQRPAAMPAGSWLQARAAYPHRRSSNANSLWWRVLPERRIKPLPDRAEQRSPGFPGAGRCLPPRRPHSHYTYPMGADWPVDEIMPLKVFARIKRWVGYAARLAQLNIGVAVQRLLKSKAPAPQSETPSEIEYYSLLAAEVSKLPKNTHLARQALYDRRWVAVAARLQGLNLDQITNEQLAFQKAICKVEIEMAMYEVGDHANQQRMRQEKRRPF